MLVGTPRLAYFGCTVSMESKGSLNAKNTLTTLKYEETCTSEIWLTIFFHFESPFIEHIIITSSDVGN